MSLNKFSVQTSLAISSGADRIDICEKTQEKDSEFKTIVNAFKNSSLSQIDERYTSFDYCFNWFQVHQNSCADDDKIEQSCLHLMCYLASWGMLRGSSILLQKSAKFYEPLVMAVAGKLDKSESNVNQKIWELDVQNYNNNFDIILETYEKIRLALFRDDTNRHIVVVTKIMLGIFGCVPALDRYFCLTFKELFLGHGFAAPNTLTKKHLEAIYYLYEQYQTEIDTFMFETKKFEKESSNSELRYYTKAKIIDMYGFNKSFLKSKGKSNE